MEKIARRVGLDLNDPENTEWLERFAAQGMPAIFTTVITRMEKKKIPPNSGTRQKTRP